MKYFATNINNDMETANRLPYCRRRASIRDTGALHSYSFVLSHVAPRTVMLHALCIVLSTLKNDWNGLDFIC